jgi:hypothetical protein
MKPYAELPARAARQLIADLAALCWLIGFAALAEHSRTLVLRMRAPASGMVDAGSGVTRVFAEMTNLAQMVPFVGGQLAALMAEGEQVGQSLSNAGQQQFDAITGMASGTAMLVMLVGVLPLLVLWLPVRLCYARAAGAAAASRDAVGGPDLLALHALSRVPLRLLRSVAEDPAAGWRSGDADVVRRLAALELDRLGLHQHRADAKPR